MSYLRQLCAVVGKDLRTEARSRDLLSTMVFLALVCVVLFRFAFDFVPTGSGALREDAFRPLGAGLLWVTILFSAVLGLDRSFAVEKEEDGLEGLILSPVDRSALLLGKALGTFVMVAIMEAVVVAAMAFFYGVSFVPVLGMLTLLLAVNTFGFVLIGTVVSFLAGASRRGALLLPVLQIPLTLPLLIFAVRGTGVLLTTGDPALAWPALKFSAVLTAVYLGVSLIVFEPLLEET